MHANLESIQYFVWIVVYNLCVKYFVSIQLYYSNSLSFKSLVSVRCLMFTKAGDVQQNTAIIH